MKVLIAGESWTVHSIHQKGFDSFTTTEYAEGVHWLRAALEAAGWQVVYQPSHVAARDFPSTAADLGTYDCIILSGFVMIGGYLTFQGIDAKGKYAGSAVEEALPVALSYHDDRVECPEGVVPAVTNADHPIVDGLGNEWPHLLGYNRVTVKAGAARVATVGNDPLIVAGTFGKGRGVAFTSDCGPHWAPPPFVEWSGYGRLWAQITGWAAGTL